MSDHRQNLDGLNKDFTILLRKMKAGDTSAGEVVMDQLYQELRRLAGIYMSRGNSARTLQPTALVNEAYLKLMGANVEIPDRHHFMGLSAAIMRNALIDYHREKTAQKRGDGAVRVTLADITSTGPNVAEGLDVIAVHEALLDLEKTDPRAAKVVEQRFFGGYTSEETADNLGISYDQARRDWTFARAFLFARLKP